ncbi:MAG: flagellar motor protein MotA [Hyphomicrobiaceae bacterium]
MAKQDAHDYGIESFQVKLSRPQIYLLRMIAFLTLVGLLCAVLYGPAISAFMNNVGLNGLILFVLFVGILFSFRQVWRLNREVNWVNAFRVADPGLEISHRPELLAPMATMLSDRRGQIALSASSMRSLMDSIASRLDEARDTSRYLVGLLIFLGLLGTFWGLLGTITSVGQTINALDTSGSDSLVVFEELKTGLQAPLQSMGTAFSSSLFGLAGSLILGFLDLQANQAQNRFYNELEEWLSAITDLGTVGGSGADGVASQLRFAIVDMQRSITDLGERLQTGLTNGQGNSSEATKELAGGIEKLVRQMRQEQKVVREWVDEQAAQQSETSSVLRELNARLKSGG